MDSLYCSASVHQCVCQLIQMLTFCIKVLREVFFSFAYSFESFLSRLLILINVTSVWLQNSWHHSAANLRSRSQTEISVEIKVGHSDYLKTIWSINMIPWGNESVWLHAWPQNKSGSLWPIFHGSVILPYILKVIWCINMIPWANESVWLDAWPENKSGSLWPIFHRSVIFALHVYLEEYLMYKHDTLG